MNDDLRADYPQISAALRHVEWVAGEIGGTRPPDAAEFPGNLPGAALLGPAADVSAAFVDCQDMLFARLAGFADAAEATVKELVLTDTEFADLLAGVLPE